MANIHRSSDFGIERYFFFSGCSHILVVKGSHAITLKTYMT